MIEFPSALGSLNAHAVDYGSMVGVLSRDPLVNT